MADLISRAGMLEALGHFNDYINGNPNFLNGIETAKEIAENLPAMDAVPVVHGRWIYHDDDMLPFTTCSICGVSAGRTRYCPNCGAKMNGERRKDDAADTR